MADYTITLTETEVKSMEYITADVDKWITNAAQNRARIAKEQIIEDLFLIVIKIPLLLKQEKMHK